MSVHIRTPIQIDTCTPVYVIKGKEMALECLLCKAMCMNMYGKEGEAIFSESNTRRELAWKVTLPFNSSLSSLLPLVASPKERLSVPFSSFSPPLTASLTAESLKREKKKKFKNPSPAVQLNEKCRGLGQ